MSRMVKMIMKQIGLVTMCAVLVLAGCSKSERPVKPTPAPKAVKTQTASNAVPEKGAGAASAKKEFITVPTKPDAREVYAKTYPFPDGKTNAPVVSPEESMRAAKERGRATAWRLMGEAIVHTQQEMDKVGEQMAVVENAARTNDQVMAAWAVMGAKRAAYDAERGKIQGMADLYKAREAAKVRLQEFNSKGNDQDAVAAATELKAEIRRLGKAMVELELKGRAESISVKQAVDDWRAAESGYQTSLMAVPSFGELAKKHQELSVQYASLVKRQSDFTKKEDRKHE